MKEEREKSPRLWMALHVMIGSLDFVYSGWEVSDGEALNKFKPRG